MDRESLLLICSAILAGCNQIANAMRGVPPDPEIANALTRQTNLEAWEKLKIFQAGLVGQIDTDTFPDPAALGSLPAGEHIRVLDLLKLVPGLGTVTTLAELAGKIKAQLEAGQIIPHPGR